MEWIFFILVSIVLHGGFFGFLKLRLSRELRAKERVAELEKEVGLLVAQLNGTADRNISILEDRILKLEDLIRRADVRIKLLEGKARRVDDSEERYREAVRSKPIPVASAPEEMGDRVLRLLREGFPPDRVAHQVGLSISEVNLIMKLQGVGS